MCITLSETGGSQRVVYDILSNLPESLYDITLVTAPGGELLDWVDALNQNRTNSIKTLTWTCLKRSISPVNDFIAFVRLLALMKRSHFDVAHFHNSKVGILGRISAKLAGTPKVYYTVHGWGLNRSTTGRLYRVMSFIERVVARFCTGIVFVSKSDMDQGLRNKWASESKARLIYNGISDESAAPRDLPDIPADVPVIVFVARLAEPKEPITALQVSERLYLDGYTHHLLIVGDGPLYPECESYIEERNLQKHASLLGMRDDVRALLARADIFCLFSKWEGLPVSILEAMIAGLPVVASAVGGVPELIEHGKTGYLVDEPNVEKAAGYLKTLLEDSDLRCRMGDAAQAAARERFGLAEMVAKYRRLYEMPSGRRHGRAS